MAEVALAPVEYTDVFARPADETNWFSPHTNTLWVESALNRVSDHEMSHLLAHASTPYGFFFQTLVDLHMRVAADYFEQTWKTFPDARIHVPVQRFARSTAGGGVSPSAAQLVPFVDRYVKPWSRLVWLERIFEGADLASVRNATRAQAIRALNEFERLFHARLRDGKLFDDARLQGAELTSAGRTELSPVSEEAEQRPDGPACPNGKWFGGLVSPIGTGHVMEGLAQQVQEDPADPGRALREPDVFTRDRAFVYWFLWYKTGELYGADTIKTRGLAGFQQLRNTVIALCDLALFTPIGPVYGRLRRTGMSWSDLHPASRYFRALQITPAVGWIDDLSDASLASFQNTICQALGWPTPEQCLRLGRLLDGRLPTWRRHRDACELRLESGVRFLIIERSGFYDQFLDTHMPLLYHALLGELAIRTSQSGQEAMELVIGHLLPRWCWARMLEGAVQLEAVLPSRLDLGRLFNDPPSRDEFLEDLVRQNPWLDDRRFQVMPG